MEKQTDLSELQKRISALEAIVTALLMEKAKEGSEWTLQEIINNAANRTGNLEAAGYIRTFATKAAILILKTKEDKVLYVNKRTSV